MGDTDLYLMTLAGLVTARVNGSGPAIVRNVALEHDGICELVSDPFNRRRLYAATMTDVYVSDDGGETWKYQPSFNLLYREICSMAADPNHEGVLYVGTAPAAVFRSDDSGYSFREMSGLRDLPNYTKWTLPPPPHLPRVRRINLDARKPGEVTIGIEEGGVARSLDGGETWQDISGPVSENTYGMPNPNSERPAYRPGLVEEGVVYRDVHELVLDPSDTDRIYATTGRGTYRTDDNGRHWRLLEYGLQSTTRYSMPVAIDPSRPERLFVGFASHGGPPSWKGYRPARVGLYWTSRYSRDTSERDNGAGSMVLRTRDGGDSWEVLTCGLPPEHAYMVCGLQINPGNPDQVFVAYTDGSVYESRDGGESFVRILEGIEKLVGLRLEPVE
jgi:hypothetical protein